MRTLATALPSTRYIWYKSLEQCKLEARLINNQIRFYEIYYDQEKCISEALVKSLFPIGCMLKDRPFLAKENNEFYAVLYRHTVQYKDQYAALKGSKKQPRRKLQLKRKEPNTKFKLKRK